TAHSLRSTSCTKTRTTSSEAAPKAAQWAGRIPELAGANESIGAKLDEVLVRVRELSFNGAKKVEKRMSKVKTRPHSPPIGSILRETPVGAFLGLLGELVTAW